MPIFEYRCAECGERFDKRVRLADVDLPVACPRCGAQGATKQLSTFAARRPSTSAGSCAPTGG